MFFFSSRRRHTRLQGDWSSDVCSSDLCCMAPIKGLSQSGESLRCIGGGRYQVWSRPRWRRASWRSSDRRGGARRGGEGRGPTISGPMRGGRRAENHARGGREGGGGKGGG